jgi:hypothetical protein
VLVPLSQMSVVSQIAELRNNRNDLDGGHAVGRQEDPPLVRPFPGHLTIL